MSSQKISHVLHSLLQEFQITSCLSVEENKRLQYQRLEQIARYYDQHSQYFSQALKKTNLNPKTFATPEGLKQFPILSRRILQSSIDKLSCQKVPAEHLPIRESKTSGSTGEPVVVKRTAVNQIYWYALTILEHLWHQRDPLDRLCAIRANIPHIQQNTWGPPIALLFPTGPSLGLPITFNIQKLVELMSEFQPNNVLVSPTTLKGMIEYCQTYNIQFPSVRHLRTINETVSDHLRQQAQTLFNCEVTDIYSSAELGVIAIQCPHSSLYHIAMPNVLLEILNEHNEECLPGEIGRIIITDLNNLAMPLIRYEIGDYAQVGTPCSCGRGWPTISKILGRKRNLIMMPDGTRHWPIMRYDICKIAPIQQFQFIQHEIAHMEMRLVVKRRLTTVEETLLRQQVQKMFGFKMRINLTYVENRIQASGAGKFEEFICKIPL